MGERKVNVRTMQTDRRRQHLIFIGLFLLLQIIFIVRSFWGFNTCLLYTSDAADD